ncbi:MAG: hypothetical protein BMS9Abin08_1107 [Gammaproteobacteria bacterium]|nr:MAG: hypothetical protein BMS9Abin08_1107 [Gammaproteobacteria bacterium]
MDSLLSLLLFAGLFYVIMRFGCGAHMARGKQGGHAGHGSGAVKHVDPVCGMEVDVEQGYGKMYEGQLYRFCSRSCLDKFDTDPERYTNPPAQGAGGET